MVGGLGNDKYVVDNVSDIVTENVGEGTDTVVSTIDYVLGANVENLTLTDTAIKGTGNALGNTVLGTAGNNMLLGQDGDDVINGRGGNDILVGGNGKDTLYGDVGADKFRFEFQSEGIDLIRDFDRSQGDKIEIIKSSFGATSLGQFSYNSTTGALSFDASPTDTIGPVQFATLTNKPAGFSVQSDLVLS
jgi:Ca2+-binding RTX toxin-like protein